MLYVINHSTVVSDADVQTMTRACATQLRQHTAPLWNREPVPVVYVSKDSIRDVAAPGAVVIAVLDDSDQAGALGWHTEDGSDLEYGRVFAKPVLDNGGDALTKALSVASVLSHEVMEWFVDAHCNLWADSDGRIAYAYEVGDPVEADSYTVPVTPRGATAPAKVTVSNFVLPAWFDPQARAGQKLDYLSLCSKPFEVRPHGYVIKLMEGKVTQWFGEQYPEWRKATKEHDTARTARRTQRTVVRGANGR